MSAKINFGAIHGRRVVTFKVSNDGVVAPSGMDRDTCLIWNAWIPAHEAFRRWKIARKAWRTRKHGKQLSLPL